MTDRPSVKVFGAALDAPTDQRRIAIKRAYMAAAAAGHIAPGDPADPYDALTPLLCASKLAERIELVGKVAVPAALTPKPGPAHRHEETEHDDLELTNSAAISTINDRVGELIACRVPSDAIALMLGVDHALTAAAVTAAAATVGADNLGVVVLDGHLDAISAEVRERLHAASQGRVSSADPLLEQLSCQTFIGHLLARELIRPHQLIVAGLYSEPTSELRERLGPAGSAYLDQYQALRASGVTLLTRDELRADPSCLSRALASLEVSHLYVSLDMDVCASPRVPAVRFHDSVGLSPEELRDIAQQLARFSATHQLRLAGADVMEIDVHLVDLAPLPGVDNETLATAIGFLEELMN